MKEINTRGISWIQPLRGSSQWYWGMDYTGGDLYEAEELFEQGHPIQKSRLVLIRYPSGEVFEPVILQEGQYFGKPVFYEEEIVLPVVDFVRGQIKIIAWNDNTEKTREVAVLPRSIAEDLYNLSLNLSPLMLTRHSDSLFQILWPDKAEYEIGNTESFCCRIHEKLYFSAWYEDPEYREELIVRAVTSGEILERRAGSFTDMPDGQCWLLV